MELSIFNFKRLRTLLINLFSLFFLCAPILAMDITSFVNDDMVGIQQGRTVSGTVTDIETNEPLLGASIVIKNTSIGASTDLDGNYSLEIPEEFEGAVELIFSYIGYTSEIKEISGTDANITLDVGLRINSTSLNEVVITANKRTQTIMEAPVSVQALSGRKLAEVGLRDLSEVLTLVPGATETVSNNIGQRQYQIRGIPQVVGDPTVGYYLGEAAFNYFGGRFSPISRSFDIQRVEVLRGPQSTLYGNGSMGGVIKFVPNSPNLTRFEGEIVGGINTVKDGDVGYFGDLMLNLPVVSDKLGLRVSGSYEEVGGYVDATDGSEENINGGDLTQFRAQLLFKPIESLNVELTYQRNSTDQSVGSFAEDVDTPSTAVSPENFFEVNNDWYIGTLTYDFKNFATLTTSTSYVDGDVKAFVFAPGITLDGENFFDLSVDNDDVFSALNHETRFVSNTNSLFQWVAGLFYTNSDFTNSTTYDPEILPRVEQVLESKAISFFGEVSYGFFDDKLRALFGLRSFSDDRSSLSSDVLIEDTFTSVNPRFNLSYRPSSNATYFFNAAKGFRSGNFNSQQIVDLHNAQGLPAEASIDSDELWSYEVGTKLLLADSQVNLEVSAYYQDWKNMQNQIAEPTFGESATYQVGDVEIPGVDILLSYAPRGVRGLSFQTSANFNGAQFKNIDPELSGPLNSEDGDRIQLVPAWTFAFTSNYSYLLGEKGWRGNILANLSHAAEQIGFGEDATGDPQTQLGLRLGVQKDNIDIVLFGNNLLGEKDPIFALNEGGLFTNFIPRPRMIGLQVGYRF